MDIRWEDRNSNYQTVSRFAEQAADRGADFLLLPEMFATGFSMNTAYTAESEDGETASFIRETARRYGMAVGGGLVLRRANAKPENCALFVDRNGDNLAVYSKTHLFSHMGEDQYHAHGNGPVPFSFEGVRCAGFICYDLRFPEVFRSICRNTEVIFVIASWPASRSLHWETLLRARSIENQLYVVGVNRTGEGDGLDFNGGTAVLDPTGKIEAQLIRGEGIAYAEIRPEIVQNVRATIPFLNDYRDD